MSQRQRFADDAAADLLTACNGLCNRAQRVIIANIKSYAALCERVDQPHKSSPWSGTPAAGATAVPLPAVKSVEIAHQVEVKLWQDLKKFKETGDKNVMQYVCGFYAGLLHMVCMSWSGCSDHFLMQPLNLLSSLRISVSAMFQPDEEPADVRLLRSLLYNLLIRLGDVNRYLKNIPVCRSYYSQARHLNPGRGHAFNQLALITTEDPVAQVYFYVRACCSIDEPVSIASHNLTSSSTRLCQSHEVVAALLSDAKAPLPVHRVTDWVQVLVIAIYAQRTGLVVKPLLDQALSCLRRKVGCNPFSSNRFEGQDVEQNSVNLMSAVDVLVDYAGSAAGRDQSLPCLTECETELKKLQIEVISVLTQSDDFAIGNIRTASSQDYQLIGFSPLRQAHEKLLFDPASAATGSDPAVKNNEFIFLIKRLRMKIDILLHVIADKSRTGSRNSLPSADTSSPPPPLTGKAPVRSRNVALKSILSGN